MHATLTAFVVGAGARRCARLEEDASLEWRRAQTARLLLPWSLVRARRVGQLQRVAKASRPVHRHLGPQSRRAGARSTSVVATLATDAAHEGAAVAEHVAVQEDIASVAAEPAGDEPAAAADGAGDDELAAQDAHAASVEGVVLLLCPRQARLDHGAVSPLRKKRQSQPSSSTRTSTHPASGSRRSSWPPTLHGTRSCSVLGRHRVERLQQSVLWRRIVGRTPGHTWRSVPLLRSPVPKIHAITWVLLQETQGRTREGVARSNDTDTPRTVPTEDRVDIERCGNHRSQATSSTLTRRAARCCFCTNAGCSPEASTPPCSSPPCISCLKCTPNSFFRARPFREPLGDDDNPHITPLS